MIRSQFPGYCTVLLFIAVLAASSCKSKKAVEGPAVDALPAQTLFDTIEARQPHFKSYAASGKMRAQTEELAIGFGVKLRMVRDSAVWLRAEKLGFEVGRALIRPDSAFVIDRLNKEYYAVDFTEFMEFYNLPFSFVDLQRILAGGTLSLTPEYMKADLADEMTRLTINAGKYKAIYWIDDLLKVGRGVLVDLEGRTADFEYADYRLIPPSANIPFDRLITFFDGDGTTELSMQFTEIEVDVPISIRFSIPDHYERMD